MPCLRLTAVVTRALAAVILVAVTGATSAQQSTIRFDLRGQRLEGMPVAWNQNKVFLLERDGYLHEFHPDEAENYSRVSQDFRSFSQAEIRMQLLQEFGRGYDVTGTGNYLVVHPVGQGSLWAQRFEDLYRSMVHYFSVRGISIQRPTFPLIAIVFPTKGEFVRHMNGLGIPVARSFLGFYENYSNRIFLYDIKNFVGQSDWRSNAETIVHEAAHQTAFNTGIHSRYSPPPRWVAEGLGTLFEAPGVYDTSTYPHAHHRVNQDQLRNYQAAFAKGIPEGAIQALVSGDRLYRVSPDAFYALSWAVTYMYAEQEPRKLSRFLKLTAARQPFMTYSELNNVQDFVQVFGSDLPMIRARVHRKMMEL